MKPADNLAHVTDPAPASAPGILPPLDVVHDPQRLAALQAYQVLDTPPEQGFDDIVTLAQQLCEVPVALVSLLDSERQWFKAKTGVELCETPLNQSVCAHALIAPDLLIIPDLTQDWRTAENPLVTGGPQIRFYAGAPLRTAEGQTLGSLCVIDTEARPDGLTEAQQEGLRALGRQVMSQLELRRALAHREAMLEQLHAHEERRALLNHELGHRLKNTLALVQSITSQTLRHTPSVEEARDVLSERLAVLGRAHDVLLSGQTDTTSLRGLVKGALAVHAERESRLKMTGPDFMISRAAALSLAMLLHELATNAVKYGALSVPNGYVQVDWTCTGAQGQEEFELVWRELDGPAVRPPTRKGFGSKLIARGLAGQVAGLVVQDYAPRGMVCTLKVPLVNFKVGELPA